MSRHKSNRQAAASGELGALRWALLQRTGNAMANAVLVTMAIPANASFECFMSVGSLAANVECHERTVQHKIRRLLLLGFISDISDRYPNRRARTYLLNAPIVVP